MEFQELLLKAEKVLMINQMEVNQANLSKLCGMSLRTFKRRLEGSTWTIDRIFGLVQVDSIGMYMMNLYSPLYFQYQPSTTRYSRGVPLPTPTYIHTTMNARGVANINEVVIGGLKLPIKNITNIDLNNINIDRVLSVVICGVLGQGYFHSSIGYETKIIYSRHFLECFQSICRSDSINSQSASYRFLQSEDKKYSFTKLFERYGSYQVGIKGYRQRLTPYTIDVFLPNVLDIFVQLEIAEPTDMYPSDIVVPLSVLKHLKPKDMMYLLSLCKGKTIQGYVIENKVQDLQHSRKYSVMTSISSDTRTKLGYIGYDISACLQTIALSILDRNSFPTHSMLMRNKHRVRAVLTARLDKTLPQVKEILSASDNGKSYKRIKTKSKLLSQYIDEAETLASQFNHWMRATHPARYNLASMMAKDELIPTGTYCSKTGRKMFEKSGEKNKYSLFFFCWTQIERDIRDVMISCVSSRVFVHEVHDAIYVHESQKQPRIEDMEQAIAEQLGLNIKIE